MAQQDLELTLNPEKAFFILIKLREFAEKVERTGLNGGSNPSDDGAVGILEDGKDDATAQELMAAMESLNIDEQIDLITMVWIGRGDFVGEEATQARRQAQEMSHKHIPQYLAQTPLASEYLEEGLSQLGYSLADYELNRL